MKRDQALYFRKSNKIHIPTFKISSGCLGSSYSGNGTFPAEDYIIIITANTADVIYLFGLGEQEPEARPLQYFNMEEIS